MGKLYQINNKVSLEESSDSYTFYLAEKAYISVNKKDKLSLKTTIVSLVNGGIAKQVELARALGLSKQAISNYLKSYRESGVSGLADRRPASHGIPEKIEKRVVELLSTSMKKMDIVKTISQEFGKSISRTKIYDIRKKHLSVIQERQSQEGNEKKK